MRSSLLQVRSYWGNPDQETRDLIVEAADALPISKDNAELLFVLANADTLRQGARVLRALTNRKPVATTPDELFGSRRLGLRRLVVRHLDAAR